jgi:hypothetical protein
VDIKKGRLGTIHAESLPAGGYVVKTNILPVSYSFERSVRGSEDEAGRRRHLIAGLQPQEVSPPLGEFQATRAEEQDTWQMLGDMNKALNSPVSEDTLKGVFSVLWPKLRERLSSLPEPETKLPAKRSTDDMVVEILELSRAGAKDRLDYQSLLFKILAYSERIHSRVDAATHATVTTLVGYLSDRESLDTLGAFR